MEEEQPATREGFWKTGLGYLTQAGIVLGAIAGIVASIAALKGGDDGGAASKAASTGVAPKLQVVDLAISGGHAPVCLKSTAVPTRVDLTVRNMGNAPAVIKRIGFKVRESALLRVPQAGGGLEPSKDYDVLLPPSPRPGELALYKVSQEIGPRGVDRFTVRVDEPEPERQLGARLYQLDVLLYHDTETKPLRAGTALVSTPYLPGKDLFWSGVPPASRGGYKDSTPADTMTTNERDYRRMLSLAGERPPELNLDVVNTPVTGNEPSPCLPSGRPRSGTAQAPEIAG